VRSADIDRLSTWFDLDADSVNYEDIGDMAADRGAMHQKGGSLSSICASIFGTALAKDDVRTSRWLTAPLSQKQLEYASLDAYMSLQLYEALLPLPVRKRVVRGDAKVGLRVRLLMPVKEYKVIARGIIVEGAVPQLPTINGQTKPIAGDWFAVKVQHVFMPIAGVSVGHTLAWRVSNMAFVPELSGDDPIVCKSAKRQTETYGEFDDDGEVSSDVGSPGSDEDFADQGQGVVSAVAPVRKKQQWSCGGCTFVNTGIGDYLWQCEVCSQPRQRAGTASRPAPCEPVTSTELASECGVTLRIIPSDLQLRNTSAYHAISNLCNALGHEADLTAAQNQRSNLGLDGIRSLLQSQAREVQDTACVLESVAAVTALVDCEAAEHSKSVRSAFQRLAAGKQVGFVIDANLGAEHHWFVLLTGTGVDGKMHADMYDSRWAEGPVWQRRHVGKFKQIIRCLFDSVGRLPRAPLASPPTPPQIPPPPVYINVRVQKVDMQASYVQWWLLVVFSLGVSISALLPPAKAVALSVVGFCLACSAIMAGLSMSGTALVVCLCLGLSGSAFIGYPTGTEIGVPISVPVLALCAISVLCGAVTALSLTRGSIFGAVSLCCCVTAELLCPPSMSSFIAVAFFIPGLGSSPSISLTALNTVSLINSLQHQDPWLVAFMCAFNSIVLSAACAVRGWRWRVPVWAAYIATLTTFAALGWPGHGCIHATEIAWLCSCLSLFSPPPSVLPLFAVALSTWSMTLALGIGGQMLGWLAVSGSTFALCIVLRSRQNMGACHAIIAIGMCSSAFAVCAFNAIWPGQVSAIGLTVLAVGVLCATSAMFFNYFQIVSPSPLPSRRVTVAVRGRRSPAPAAAPPPCPQIPPPPIAFPWLSSDDIIFVLSALLGTGDFGQPMTWKAFFDNIEAQYQGGNRGDRYQGARWRDWRIHVINTDVSDGLHWLMAMVKLESSGPIVTVIEPYPHSAYSRHIDEHMLRLQDKYRDGVFLYRKAGIQRDGWQCGYYASWWQLMCHVGFQSGCMITEPQHPPANWVKLVRLLLQIKQYVDADGTRVPIADVARNMFNQTGTLQDVIAATERYMIAMQPSQPRGSRVPAKASKNVCRSSGLSHRPMKTLIRKQKKARCKKSPTKGPRPVNAMGRYRKTAKLASSFAVPAVATSEPEDPTIYSRVLKDIFHVMNCPYLPRNHGAFLSFYWAYRDAVFIPNPEDVKAVLDVFRNQGDAEVTLSEVMDQRWEYFSRRVRRYA
jgi:hypothetical protein